jgi:hypothetical protein
MACRFIERENVASETIGVVRELHQVLCGAVLNVPLARNSRGRFFICRYQSANLLKKGDRPVCEYALNPRRGDSRGGVARERKQSQHCGEPRIG